MATRKAKRKLSDISFEKEGAHVALVSKDQGGPANLHDYALVLKANNFSEEFIQKMQQVKVTLELPDFLQKFFGLYYEDAEVLARFMGYQPPESETQDVAISYEDYIQSKLQSFEVLKAANDSESLAQVLSELDETEYLAMLQDQEYLEQVFKQAEAKTESDTSVQVTKADDTSPACEVNDEEVSASINKETLEKSTMDENQKEMVEKATLELLQKSFDEQKQALEKALESLAQFEAEKKAAIEKARKDEIVAAVKDEAKAEILFKAVKDVSDEDFQAVVKTLTEMQSSVEKSALFEEQGSSAQEETEVIQESAVAKLLKAKQAKK
jgi:hypothetical protein